MKLTVCYFDFCATSRLWPGALPLFILIDRAGSFRKKNRFPKVLTGSLFTPTKVTTLDAILEMRVQISKKKSGDEWPVGDEIDTFSIQLINLSYFFCSPRDSPDHTLLILLFIRKSRVCLFINVNWIEKTDRKNGFFVSPPGTEWVLTQALGFC